MLRKEDLDDQQKSERLTLREAGVSMTKVSKIISKDRKLVASFPKDPLHYGAKPFSGLLTINADAQKGLLYYNVR